jgi:hypothetical protein
LGEGLAGKAWAGGLLLVVVLAGLDLSSVVFATLSFLDAVLLLCMVSSLGVDGLMLEFSHD